MNTRARPPGPRGRALLRTIIGRRRDPVALFTELKATYGNIVHMRLGDMSQFLVSDPTAAQHVLVENHRNYTKGPGYELLSAALGRGLITSEGSHWRSHRAIIQPVLRRERLAAFSPVMAEAAADEAAALRVLAQEGATVDMYQRMNDLTLRVAARTLLGTDVQDREAEIQQAMSVVFDRVERLSTSRLRYLEFLPGASRLRWVHRLAATLPTPARKSFDRAMATLDDIIYGVIARRRRAEHEHGHPKDLVALLEAAVARADGPPLSDEDIRDEILTMFIASYETTATTLAWALYELAHHPSYRQKIAQEADAALGDRAPRLDDLPQLVTSRQVFEETMRMYPPIWRISRYAVGPDRIADHHVPPGSIVTVSPYLMQRDPAYWPDPDRFDPGRFEVGEPPAHGHGAFLPFGAGPRKCPGGAFAGAEAQIVLTALCRSVAFETELGFPGFEPRVTLRPKGGMPLRLLPRDASRASPDPSTQTL